MKTRLQLARGYIAGTLTPDEERAVSENPNVLSEIARLAAEKNAADLTSSPAAEPGEKKEVKPKKGGKHG